MNIKQLQFCLVVSFLSFLIITIFTKTELGSFCDESTIACLSTAMQPLENFLQMTSFQQEGTPRGATGNNGCILCIVSVVLSFLFKEPKELLQIN